MEPNGSAAMEPARSAVGARLAAVGAMAAIAIVQARSRSSAVVVHDLSPAGAMLIGDTPLARGELISLVVQRLTLCARVSSVELLLDGRQVAAIEFRDVSPGAQHFLTHYL